MQYRANSRPSEVILEATVFRKDGTVEVLGEIAHYYRNPLKRWNYRLQRRFGKR